MTVTHIIILLLTGAGAGFAGSILGLGGAFIMTPVQYMIYTTLPGISADTAIKLAFGTNLMVILPTAISGTWRHHRNGTVFWRSAIVMGSCSLIGSFGGAAIAARLPGEGLTIAFGILVLIGGVWMVFSRPLDIEDHHRTNPLLWIAWAIPIGIITGILGIGGGILAVPVMTLALRFRMHNATATSLAMMILTSTGGVIGYIISGTGVSDLPAYCLGYVNLQSWLLLSVTSISMAQVGAIVAHRIPARLLKYLFVTIMFYMGLRMLGIFERLGWPL
ncbi:MAG: sulfite exporter TauE/SafE family protein [Dehalococcoidales bacterium]|nr:MAG: sulfite exporter TauE/SafE family protein [Dehalococcoidales bacterium]